MTLEPLISLCMPCYNAGPYLAEAIEGILNQSYPHLEIVICDNGSTDDSVAIAQRYIKQDKRVRFYQNQWNLGFAGNVSKTTALAKGDFLLIHAADDIMLPGALQRFVDTIHQVGGDPQDLILMTDYYVVNQQGERRSRVSLSADGQRHMEIPLSAEGFTTIPIALLNGHDVLKYRFPRLITLGWVGSIFFSRQLYDAIEGCYNNHWINPDKQIMFKLLSRNPRVVWLREALFHYRVHDFSQNAQQAESGVLKYLLDQYAYTFEFDRDFYDHFSKGREAIVRLFVESDCLNTALREMAVGSRKLGFRHLCFGLATYPDIALRSLKTYVALGLWLSGPLGRPLAAWLFRRRQTRMLNSQQSE